MKWDWTEEQQGIRGGLKQILGDIVTDDALKALDKEGVWHHDRAWQALAQAEMLGIALPESVGGAGFGIIELCLLLQQVGRTVAQVPALPTLVSAALPIAEYGTDAQKERLLSGVARGETILSAGFVAGQQNAKQPLVKAEADGEGFKLSGTLTNVSYAEQAERILVGAKTGEGIVVCLVDPKAAGVSIAAQKASNGEPLGQLTLDGAVVAADDVLAREDEGAEVLSYTVDRTMLGMCALQHGVCQQALIMTANYSGERKQFGVPIGTFQAVKQRLADAYIDVQSIEVTMWQAAWRLSEGLEADKELAVAKFTAAEAGARVVFAAQHVHGGMGFDRDYPLYRYFLTSKNYEFHFGGAESTLQRLGAMLSA